MNSYLGPREPVSCEENMHKLGQVSGKSRRTSPGLTRGGAVAALGLSERRSEGAMRCALDCRRSPKGRGTQTSSV